MSNTKTTEKKPQKIKRQSFKAEVAQLLHMMVHSVYSDKDIFLRELISNAADACEKLRYLAIAKPELLEGDEEFAIQVKVNKEKNQLHIIDNGIGMSETEMAENLGTIARSGTRQFMESLEKNKDGNALIGQFGVGFYSAFMVADKVVVNSRKAGESEANQWVSDGKGKYSLKTLDTDEMPRHGSEIILQLNKDSTDYADMTKVETIIRNYSANVPIAIKVAESGKEEEARQIAEGGALWKKNKSAIKDEDYNEFYKLVSGQFDDPEQIIHYKAEGRHEYSVLLYIPSMPPFDLFNPDRRGKVKLYVRQVFISDEASILPPWLRFMRGVIDSTDLPLNLSREMLQNNPILDQIKKGVTNRILTELTKLADKNNDKYLKIWQNFGPVLKEGIYEDMERRDKLYELVRFKSWKSGEDWLSLKAYVEAMPKEQSVIYYALGKDLAALQNSPHLEGFRARDIDVLLLTDPVDAFWVQTAVGFEGKQFKSVSQGEADLADIAEKEKSENSEDKTADEGQIATLITRFTECLGEQVSEVRKSARLKDSAVCIVAAEMGPDLELQRILAQHQNNQTIPSAKPVLELNPKHSLIVALAEGIATNKIQPDFAAEIAQNLLDTAILMDGEALSNPQDFAKRNFDLISRAIV